MTETQRQNVLLVVVNAQEKFGNFVPLLEAIQGLHPQLDLVEIGDFVERLPEVAGHKIMLDYFNRKNSSESEYHFTNFAKDILSGEEVYRLHIPPAPNTRNNQARRKK